MFARYVWIIAFVFLGGCGGGINILPEPFTRERADGKIPVKVELIREQVRKELDGMPEGEAEVLRWQAIEKDYNECRLSSAESSKEKAEEVFAVCMSQRDYVYMLPIDAEQFHNDIFFELRKEKEESERLAEERRIAAEKKAKEDLFIKEAEKSYDECNYITGLFTSVNCFSLSFNLKKEAKAKGIDEDVVDKLVNKYETARESAKKKMEAERIAAAEKAEQYRWEDKLRIYTREGELSEVQRLLSLGVNPNAADISGWTVLMWAAIRGNSEVAKVLLNGGANLNAVSNDGWTALMFAAWEGHAEVAELLLSSGANLNAVSNDGWTALIRAAQRGHAEVVKMLLSAGADVNAKDEKGWTALYTAVLWEHAKIAKVLLDIGANPDAADDDGDTALMWAVGEGNAEVAKILLAAGANPNAANNYGVTALMSAANFGHAEVAKMMLSAGANPNAVDNEGWTALAFAVKKLYFDIAEILLKAKANPNHVFDDDGISVMDNAIYDNHPDMIALLRRYGGVCRKNC